MSGEGTTDCVAGNGVGIGVCGWLSKQLARAEEQWQPTGEAFSCPYAWMGASRAGLEAGERASQQSKTGEKQWMLGGGESWASAHGGEANLKGVATAALGRDLSTLGSRWRPTGCGR